MSRLERKRLRGSSLECRVVDAEKADGADWQPIQARVRPFTNPPFSDSFSPPRSQGGSSGKLVRSSSFSGVWRSLGLRQPAAAFPRQPCCRRSLQAAGKPLRYRYRKRGNVMAKWSHGMLDGQQAGLPKAAAGCRSPCPVRPRRKAHEPGFDKRMGTGEWIRLILLSPFFCRCC